MIMIVRCSRWWTVHSDLFFKQSKMIEVSSTSILRCFFFSWYAMKRGRRRRKRRRKRNDTCFGSQSVSRRLMMRFLFVNFICTVFFFSRSSTFTCRLRVTLSKSTRAETIKNLSTSIREDIFSLLGEFLFLFHPRKRSTKKNNVNDFDPHLIRKWQIARQIFLRSSSRCVFSSLSLDRCLSIDKSCCLFQSNSRSDWFISLRQWSRKSSNHL